LGSDIVAAYEQLGGEDVVFADEVVARFNDGDAHPMRGWISIPENRPDGIVRGYRLLMGRSDDERLSHLEDAYECFLEADAAWRAEPSFYNAWHWLDAHPAFWTRPRHVSEVIASARGRDAVTREEPWAARLWDWETSGYCGKLWVRPVRDIETDDDALAAADDHAAAGDQCGSINPGSGFGGGRVGATQPGCAASSTLLSRPGGGTNRLGRSLVPMRRWSPRLLRE
jgi:hypothetical protein